MSLGTNITTRVGILSPDIYLPTDDPILFQEVINERERETGLIMNQKENAVYALVEVQTSQVWFSADPQVGRNGFRTVYETGVLSNGNNFIAHGLDTTTLTFTHMYGAITDGTNSAPIPNPSVGSGMAARIEIDPTNILIDINAGFGTWSGHVVLEYVRPQ